MQTERVIPRHLHRSLPRSNRLEGASKDELLEPKSLVDALLIEHELEVRKDREVIELSETRYCSATAMLGAVAEITSRYEIEDEAEKR